MRAGDRVRGAPPDRADRGRRQGRAGDAPLRSRPRRDAPDAQQGRRAGLSLLPRSRPAAAGRSTTRGSSACARRCPSCRRRCSDALRRASTDCAASDAVATDGEPRDGSTISKRRRPRCPPRRRRPPPRSWPTGCRASSSAALNSAEHGHRGGPVSPDAARAAGRAHRRMARSRARSRKDVFDALWAGEGGAARRRDRPHQRGLRADLGRRRAREDRRRRARRESRDRRGVQGRARRRRSTRWSARR